MQIPGRDPKVLRAVSLIGRLSDLSGLDFDPLALTRAVNFLIEMGRESALQALHLFNEQTHAVDREQGKLRLVTRALFLPRQGQSALPELAAGRPDVGPPADESAMPAFPLHFHQGLPLLLVGGYLVGGEALPVKHDLDCCIRNCDMRTAALVLPDNPLTTVDNFLESDLWKSLQPDDWHKGMLRAQALRAVSEIYPVASEELKALLQDSSTEKIWTVHRERVAALQPVWNQQANEYQFHK